MGVRREHMRETSSRFLVVALVGCALLAFASAPCRGQVSPEEHAKHHPAPGQQPTSAPAGGMGGMGGGMGGCGFGC